MNPAAGLQAALANFTHTILANFTHTILAGLPLLLVVAVVGVGVLLALRAAFR